MSSAFTKCPCQVCGVHLEVPTHSLGSLIHCPQCAAETELRPLPETGEESGSGMENRLSAEEVLAGFQGNIAKGKPSFFYRMGLFVVCIAMLLLPILYLGMIAGAARAAYWWATHYFFLVQSGRGGGRLFLIKLGIYLGPLFAGLVLIFFMVKPLFARRPPRAQPLALNPEAEPALFAFIAKVCAVVGAPFPSRIDLDCNLNASASFRRGAFSLAGDDLVLTIGMPLVAALNLREFAGVLAHEFGHFTQGFGMRLSYVIRHINAWFARLVYERDSWDLWLAQMAETEELWSGIIVAGARLAVWFSRLLLTLLMCAGHAIGCFMLRQMEYDADRYEIKMAGSDVFETTTRRLHVLAKALEASYKTMRTTWNLNHVLPENFPAYLLRAEESLSPAQRQQLEDTMGLETTKAFDTHPSQGDRIRRARQAAQPGIFHLDAPASRLFSQFEVPAKQVTILHYEDDLGIPLMAARLEPVFSPSQQGEPESGAESSARPRFKVRFNPPRS